MISQPALYVNGRFITADTPAITALDRGLMLADGVFETLIATSRGFFRLDAHLERLTASAAVLALPLPATSVLTKALEDTLATSGLDRAVLRLTVTRGLDTGRGIAVRELGEPSVVIRAAPLAPYAPTGAGINLHTCSFPRNERSPVAQAKTLAYAEAIAAWLEARRAGAEDALLLNTQGNAACATTSNLFAVRGKALLTPGLDQGVLPGVARRTVLELARAMGMETRECAVTPGDLAEADELFLTNVVRGPLPVERLDARAIQAGPVAALLADDYWALVG